MKGSSSGGESPFTGRVCGAAGRYIYRSLGFYDRNFDPYLFIDIFNIDVTARRTTCEREGGTVGRARGDPSLKFQSVITAGYKFL